MFINVLFTMLLNDTSVPFVSHSPSYCLYLYYIYSASAQIPRGNVPSILCNVPQLVASSSPGLQPAPISSVQFAHPGFSGGSAEYFVAYSDFNNLRGFIRSYGSGQFGIPFSGTGDHAVQGLGPGISSSSVDTTSAFDDQVVFGLSSTITGSSALLTKQAGPDGIMGTGDELTRIVMASTPPPNYSIIVAGWFSNYGNQFDLVANGMIYAAFINGAFYFVRQNSGLNRLLESPFLYASDDTLEFILPVPIYVHYSGYLQTSASKLSSWVRDINLGGDVITTFHAPGPNSFLGDQDDEVYTLGGGDVTATKTALAPDGSRAITVQFITSTPLAGETAVVYDLIPGGGRNGRITMPPVPYTILTEAPTNANVMIDAVDIAGPFTDRLGRQIDGAIVIVYSYLVRTGQQPQLVTVIKYQDTGPNSMFENPGDDRIVRYSFTTNRLQQAFMPPVVRWVSLADNTLAIAGNINGADGVHVMNVC